MATSDPVPEADRLEQERSTDPDDRHPDRGPRESRHPHLEASDADAFEQDLPRAEGPANRGIDADRSEPLDNDGGPTAGD